MESGVFRPGDDLAPLEMAEYRRVPRDDGTNFPGGSGLRVWAALAGPAGLTVSAVSPFEAGAALAQSDLDEFMRQVLAKRDENWKKLQQYVLDEHEKVDIVGPQLVRIVGTRRDYRWFIKDGYFVRSPVTADGIPVPEAERRRAEDEYLRQAKAREKRDGTVRRRRPPTPMRPRPPKATRRSSRPRPSAWTA